MVNLARPPVTLAASRWQLPSPSPGDDDLVGMGADLAPETLVDAYRKGIFPWPHGQGPLPWFSPDPRAVIDPDGVHVSRSLRRTLRRSGWTTTVDRDFPRVIEACAGAPRPHDDGTWITDEMVAGYVRIHELGWAHSTEVWDGSDLVGGLYGVQLGAVFTGESMFHDRSDASKVALVDLAHRLREAGGRLIDVQMATEHLVTLGARETPRAAFLAELAAHRDVAVRLPIDPRPVARLAK